MKTIKLLFITALTGCMSLQLAAQETILSKTGEDAADMVPEGWSYHENRGDLNQDGIDDMVLVTSSDKTSRPVMGIYWGDGQGQFNLYQQYDSIIPYSTDDFSYIDNAITITPKGVLCLNTSVFQSAGSNTNWSQTLLFRYQDGDFYLIGSESESMSRYSGEIVRLSKNYLTHKQKKSTSNAFDEGIKPHTTWSDLPKEPLQRLNDFRLE